MSGGGRKLSGIHGVSVRTPEQVNFGESIESVCLLPHQEKLPKHKGIRRKQ